MSRLIIANLAAEIDMARMVTPGPHPDVRPGVAERIAVAGSHLSVFARPGDRLWLPAELPADCPRAPGVEYLTGPLADIQPSASILAWAETPHVENLRMRTSPVRDRSSSSWMDELFALHPTAKIAAECNHRRFAFGLAADRGWSLPGACLIRSISDLERALASGAAEAGGDAWVIKAPLAAAGRERLQQRGTSLSAQASTRAKRLLARYGELLWEPWVERLVDLACCGLVSEHRVHTFPCHTLVSDDRGIFRAARIDDRRADDCAKRAVRRVAAIAGRALASAGYRGPFSVDAFVWRDHRSGAVRLQPLSEINGRLTFGLVARAMAASGQPFQLAL